MENEKNTMEVKTLMKTRFLTKEFIFIFTK
jgi:hypothetical protein